MIHGQQNIKKIIKTFVMWLHVIFTKKNYGCAVGSGDL
jgi:hypothetical protein